MFSAFSFANVLENTGAYLSLQQKKDLCNFLEKIPGHRGTEELRKEFFPQMRMYQVLFKCETLTGKELSIEQWRTLCQRLGVEQQFSDRLQGFELRRNPRRGFILNSQSRRAYEVYIVGRYRKNPPPPLLENF